MNLNHFTFSPLITAIATFILGVFVLLKRRWRKPLYLFFALYSFSIAWWSFCATKFTPDFKDPYLIWGRLLHLGAILIPVFFIHFVYEFLEEKNKKIFIFTYLIASTFLILNFFTHLFIKGITHKPEYSFPTPAITYPFYFSLFIFCVILGLYKLFRASLSATGMRRNQIKYLLWSSLFGYLGGSKNFMILMGLEIFPIYPYGTYAIPLYVLTVTYAIVKYRLMDINIALTRAGIFAFVYLLVLGIPFWVGHVTKSWFPSTAFAVLLATPGPFIYNYIRRRTENLLLADQRRYQETLRRLSATLTLVKDLERLLKLVVYRVARAVRVEFACIYLVQNHQNVFLKKSPYSSRGVFPVFPEQLSYHSEIVSYLSQKHKPVFSEELRPEIRRQFGLKSGLIIPSFVRGRLLGFLILGPKSSGAIYTPEDAAVFEVLANQMALAIENTEFISESQRTQAQLFAAERMTSLGVMARGLSHQINNRFHAIMMATSDTLDTLKFINIDSCSQEIKDYIGQIAHALERIQENAKHGGKIVNDFLDFSQPDRLQKEAKEFDLREPLGRAIEMVKIKTTFSEESIEKEIPDGLPLIQGDSVLLQNVFFNLIDNAFDAIKEKEKFINTGTLKPAEPYKGRVKVSIAKIDSAVIIKIQDNGIGIKEENRKKIFSPFFTTKASSAKGTGLGLFVIQKIVNTHQGEIRVSSEYGQGTIFTITLPLSHDDR